MTGRFQPPEIGVFIALISLIAHAAQAESTNAQSDGRHRLQETGHEGTSDFRFALPEVYARQQRERPDNVEQCPKEDVQVAFTGRRVGEGFDMQVLQRKV